MESLKNIIHTFLKHPSVNLGQLDKIVQLSQDIPQKCKHFQLKISDLRDIADRRSMFDCAVSISLEKETFRNLHAEELFKYARKLEEKYAGDISQLKFFSDKISLENGFMYACNQAYLLIKNFDNQEEVIRLFEDGRIPNMLETPLKEWFSELDNDMQEMSPAERILSSWYIHFAVLTALPAFPRYTVFARLCQQIYLRIAGLCAENTLFLSPDLLLHQNVYKRICDQLKFKRWDDLPKSDMSSLFNFGMEIHTSSIEIANRLVREVYHEKVEFEDLSPRQRNMVNFFFDEGFRMHKPELENLNERQDKILEIIYERHFISTKDLSLIFRCNRKTIQRDFNELLEMGYVRQMGNGAALRYTVQIRNKPNHALQKMQNMQLGEAPAQFSLFSEQWTLGI